MRVLSLGWGVQSFGLAAMSALGVLPTVDAAIHADTTHERAETYAFARKWTPWLEERGVRVVTVKGRKTDFATEPELPAHTTLPDGTPTGMLRRQCTSKWKIYPIRAWVREHMQPGEPVEQWLGITLDEVQRATISDVKYIRLVYPFLDRRWRRSDVVQWLQANGLDVPVKSSCVFCPFHDRATWRTLKQSGDGDWNKALEIDQAIRHKRPNYVCYLSAQHKPLAECDFSSPEDHGQMTLWEAEECSGVCFL